MPNSHEPSLRVPSPRLPQSAHTEPPAYAGGLLLSATLARAALHPLRFVLGQLWIGAAPLADLLGLPLFTASPDEAIAAAPDRLPGEAR